MPKDHDADLKDLLHGRPARDAVQPPVISRPQALPFNQLSWENFERLNSQGPKIGSRPGSFLMNSKQYLIFL